MDIGNEPVEQRASFHLGDNDDDLSNDSAPRTSPTSKHTEESEALKRVRSVDRTCFSSSARLQDTSLSKLTSGSLKKDNLLTLASLAASTSTPSSTVKPDDKVAQDRFMQYQKQAKLKAEQVGRP